MTTEQLGKCHAMRNGDLQSVYHSAEAVPARCDPHLGECRAKRSNRQRQFDQDEGDNEELVDPRRLSQKQQSGPVSGEAATTPLEPVRCLPSMQMLEKLESGSTPEAERTRGLGADQPSLVRADDASQECRGCGKTWVCKRKPPEVHEFCKGCTVNQAQAVAADTPELTSSETMVRQQDLSVPSGLTSTEPTAERGESSPTDQCNQGCSEEQCHNCCAQGSPMMADEGDVSSDEDTRLLADMMEAQLMEEAGEEQS